MFIAVLCQIIATLGAAVIIGLLAGETEAISAGMGGAVVFIPNFLLALRLWSVSGRASSSYPVNFFVGEFVKIAATIGLLVIAVKTYSSLHWPSFLAGMVVALQAVLIAFWKKS